MPAKNLLFAFVCFAYGWSAPLYAQVTHATSASKTTTKATLEMPASGANSAANPRLIRYDGILKDQPSSAAVAIIFSVYASGDSAKPLWQETQNIQPDQDGRYTAFLGASDPGGLPRSEERRVGKECRS